MQQWHAYNDLGETVELLELVTAGLQQCHDLRDHHCIPCVLFQHAADTLCCFPLPLPLYESRLPLSHSRFPLAPRYLYLDMLRKLLVVHLLPFVLH